MAYASVNSLTRTIESVLHSNSPMQSLICDHRGEFLALGEKISSLEVLVKKFEEGNNSGKMIDLDARIKEAANVVEHVIQVKLTETLRANDETQKKVAHERLCNSLQQVAEEIDRVYKESTNFQDKGKQASNKPLVQYSSSKGDTPKMVGRDDERERLSKDLTRCYSGELKVISIIGMGGIGKTTLAKEVYNDSFVRSHFDVCAWATVSQQYNTKEIFLNLLRCTKGDKFHKGDESELADILQKSLKGKRYLVIMDDMWSSNAWDDLMQCFPSENNASRILLTTRNTEVAHYVGSENLSLQMNFMDSGDSWNLFKTAAFTNEILPSELESIGKQITDKCQGLPLTIVVVAGLLSKLERATEVWKTAAENVMSFVTNDPNEQCLHVLGLSFNHLSGDLKACLLYFGVFPEAKEISANRLLRLWIAEGFLKLEKDLEREAETCLQDLIDRCLVLVSSKSLDETEIRSCKVHDLIYELCLREAQRQNFCIMNEFFNTSYRAVLIPGHRAHGDDDDDNLLRRTHAIFSFDSSSSFFTLKPELIQFDLLRILDLSLVKFKAFPQQILCLIWLRYLALFKCEDGVSPEICRLWNLQTFIVEYGEVTSIFTEQIWELTQLRCLRLPTFYLPNPLNLCVEEERYLGFPEIHTVRGLSPSSCTKEVMSGIRNVKKLEVCGSEAENESCQETILFDNLVRLHQLENLSVKFEGLSDNTVSPVLTIRSSKVFPATLKKLRLERTFLRWEDLDIIGELPNLAVLKLAAFACQGEEWNPIVGGFTRLKVLLIQYNRLKYWKATNENFPVLERLFIKFCFDLDEIPFEFADIPSLQLIELNMCKSELSASAARIQQEQEDLGNEPVDVRILLPLDNLVEAGAAICSAIGRAVGTGVVAGVAAAISGETCSCCCCCLYFWCLCCCCSCCCHDDDVGN